MAPNICSVLDYRYTSTAKNMIAQAQIAQVALPVLFKWTRQLG